MVLVAASAVGPARPACPGAAALRQALEVEGAAWRVACTATKDGEVEMAALLPPTAAGSFPRLVVSVRRGQSHPRAELTLDGLDRDGLKALSGEDWQVSVRPAAIKPADWVRVDITAQSGEDLRVAQTVTALFRVAGPIQPLWTGASERHELRFDACSLDTTARFTLSRTGELVRARRTRRRFRDPGGVDAATLTSAKAECLATPPARDTFTVADDGLDADVTVEPSFRARARANRLLFIRASASDEAFARFVADSVALLEPLSSAVTGTPLDPEQEMTKVAVSGAFAYSLEGGLRVSLDWKHLGAVAKPASQNLIAALQTFDGDNYQGAWIDQRTDLGGCHSPAQAEPALRKLVAAWQSASDPVRGTFRDHLTKRLTEMTSEDCFCASKGAVAKLQQEIERNAALLEGMPELGALAAQQLRALPAAPGTTFGCGGPH